MTTVARPAVPTPQHFINGEFVAARSGGTFEVVDPATEALTTLAARGDAQDIDAAVRAAKEAFDGGAWSRAKPSFRRKVLFKAADLIEARSDEIIKLQSLEMGGPIGAGASGPASDARAFGVEFPVLRGGAGTRRQRIVQSRRQPADVHDARSGRRIRPDHAVERAVHAVDVEDGAVSCVRQLGGAQAVGVVAVVDPRVVRNFPGSRHAGRRLQHGARLWRRSGRAARRAQRRHRRVVHRLAGDRARHRGARGEVVEAHVVRTGRQVGQHHLRGRESRARDSGRRDVDLHERGSGVRRRLAHPRAAADLRAISRRIYKSGGRLESGRSVRPHDAARSARAQAPIRSRDGLSRDRAQRRPRFCSAAGVRRDLRKAITSRRPRSSMSTTRRASARKKSSARSRW